MTKLIYKTFNEWAELGYYIYRGEKSNCSNDAGEPLFSELQVYVPSDIYEDRYASCDYEDDELFYWDPWMF